MDREGRVIFFLDFETALIDWIISILQSLDFFAFGSTSFFPFLQAVSI